MVATQRGIYHNLKESKYTISNTEIVFFFSSEFYLNKFMEGYKENRIALHTKIYKHNPNNVLNMDVFADISFYKTIEKRGFRCLFKGVEMSWHDLQKYALRKMTEPNSQDWRRIPKPKLIERLKLME